MNLDIEIPRLGRHNNAQRNRLLLNLDHVTSKIGPDEARKLETGLACDDAKTARDAMNRALDVYALAHAGD